MPPRLVSCVVAAVLDDVSIIRGGSVITHALPNGFYEPLQDGARVLSRRGSDANVGHRDMFILLIRCSSSAGGVDDVGGVCVGGVLGLFYVIVIFRRLSADGVVFVPGPVGLRISSYVGDIGWRDGVLELDIVDVDYPRT